MMFPVIIGLALLPQQAPSNLEASLPSNAGQLADALVENLIQSDVLDERGISAIAFPRVSGDVKGALRDQILSRLLGGDIKLERIAEREERHAIVDRYFRVSEHEEGLYDLDGLKKLGREFKDNEGLLGARVYTVEGLSGLEVYAQAELIDAQHMVQVWSFTTQLVLGPEPEQKADSSLLDIKWVLGLAALCTLILLGSRSSSLKPSGPSRKQTRKARERGEVAVVRQQERKRGVDLRKQAARRLHDVADRVNREIEGADSSNKKHLRAFADATRRQARSVEALPAGSSRGTVSVDGDSNLEASSSLANHDAGSLALVEEIEKSGNSFHALLQSGVSVEVQVKEALSLLDRLSQRLGERSDLHSNN